jgi:hypothetical protein
MIRGCSTGARFVAGRILRPLTKTLVLRRRRIPRCVIASTARPPRRAKQRTPQRTLRVHSGAIGSTATGSSASFRASQSRDNGSRSGFRLLVAALHFASVVRLRSRVRPKRVRVPVRRVSCLTAVSPRVHGARTYVKRG